MTAAFELDARKFDIYAKVFFHLYHFQMIWEGDHIFIIEYISKRGHFQPT